MAAKRKTSPRGTARRARSASRSQQTTGRRSARRSARKTPAIAARNVTPAEMAFIRRHADQLSKTTLRAKWLHSPDQREDRPGQSLATRAHEVIEHWAEERGARPATVPGTEHDDRPGVLRFDFPGYGGDRLQKISWKDWFRSFDARELVFLFQEHKRDGHQSNFFKLDSPEREHD